MNLPALPPPNALKITGGARIGLANAGWPLSALYITRNCLYLNASVIGSCAFLPEDIVALKPYRKFLSTGIQIQHRVKDYNSHIIFWTNSPEQTIAAIRQSGFLDADRKGGGPLRTEVQARQAQGSFALKWPFVIGFAVIWNLLMLPFFLPGAVTAAGKPNVPDVLMGPLLAIGFLLATCVLLLSVPNVQGLALKEGRSVADLKPFLFLLIAIASFMLIPFSIIFFFAGR